MTVSLMTPGKRARLAPRQSPYWVLVEQNFYIGLYVGGRGSRWKVRIADPDGKTRWRVGNLGAESDFDWKAARAAADDWREAQEAAVTDGVLTVGTSVDCWVAHKVDSNAATDIASDATQADWSVHAGMIAGFFGADTPIADLTVNDVSAYRDQRLKTGKTRALSSRDAMLGKLKAALNHACRVHEYKGPRAWDRVEKYGRKAITRAKADADEDLVGRVLSIAQVRELIAHIDEPEVAVFIEVMFGTMQRPQALRMADVRDFTGDTLRLRRGKNAVKHGVLDIPLFEGTKALLRGLTDGRKRNDALIPGPDGQRLPQRFQRYPVARAVKRAGLPSDTTLYAVRRGAISWALTDGGLDVLTVAKMADTSPEMIIKHYFDRTTDMGAGPVLRSADVVRLGEIQA